MKPPLFEYILPNSLEEAIAARSANEYSAILAGGQSLIPTMNFRIANPGVLIDISRIDGLTNISIENDEVVVGAMVRQRDLELNKLVHAANPLVHETLEHVAHVPIRCRGTVVGSLAHADAAAELPALLLVTDGYVKAEGKEGTRKISADSLFQFHMTTSLAPNEIITEVRIPVLSSGAGWAFLEFTRRHGDYAVAGVTAIISLSSDGSCSNAALAACGIGSRPVRLIAAEQELLGTFLDNENIDRAAEAAKPLVTSVDDSHASTEFRKHVLATILKRTVKIAKSRAGGD